MAKAKLKLTSSELAELDGLLDPTAVVHEAGRKGTAAVFGISKSTVHKDITVRLPRLHAELSAQVQEIIEKNKQERHIRGGLATKRKYERQRAGSRYPLHPGA